MRDNGGAGRTDRRDGSQRISVVIPCYNHAQFVGEAIESVLGQTCANYQLLVVDDGSTDDTPQVVQRYPTVTYIRQENAGRSAARNNGLVESRGDFVMFLDADDRLLPHALAAALESFRDHPECAFVSGLCRMVDAGGSAIAMPQQRVVKREHYVQLLRGGTYIWCPASVAYQRQVFDFVHGFDPATEPVEDYDLYLRITRDFVVHSHGHVVAEYRQHAANTSRDFAPMQRAAQAVHAKQWAFAKGNAQLRESYRAGERFWAEQYPIQQVTSRIREIVRDRLPPDAAVAVASGGENELLRLDGRPTLPFPPSPSEGELFAEGAEGSVTTPAWIEPGMTYDFGLYRGADLLARVSVQGITAGDPVPAGRGATASAGANGALLVAEPNPVVIQTERGRTTIRWRTGDGSQGQVYAISRRPGPEPTDSDEAWRYVELIKERGAQYLIIPANSFCAQAKFSDFRQHLEHGCRVSARVENVCTIYDLRESPDLAVNQASDGGRSNERTIQICNTDVAPG